MTDHFDAANAAARDCALKLLETEIPPTVAADAFIAYGLSIWAAETGRDADAHELIRAWTLVRDMESD